MAPKKKNITNLDSKKETRAKSSANSKKQKVVSADQTEVNNNINIDKENTTPLDTIESIITQHVTPQTSNINQENKDKKKCKIFEMPSLILLGFVFLVSFFASIAGDGVSAIATKSKIKKVVLKVIQDNPDKIMQSIIDYQRNQDIERRAEINKNLDQYLVSIKKLNNAYLGNKNGKTVIYEFLDTSCGYCKKAHNIVKRILADNPDVKVKLLHYPILGSSSLKLGQILYASFLTNPRKYEEIHNKFLETKTALSDAKIAQILSEAGLNPKKIIKKSSSKEVQKYIQSVRDIASKLGINGTPAFIINDKLVPGYIQYQAMKDMLAN